MKRTIRNELCETFPKDVGFCFAAMYLYLSWSLQLTREPKKQTSTPSQRLIAFSDIIFLLKPKEYSEKRTSFFFCKKWWTKYKTTCKGIKDQTSQWQYWMINQGCYFFKKSKGIVVFPYTPIPMHLKIEILLILIYHNTPWERAKTIKISRHIANSTSISIGV